jgi:hypothetical protein
MEKNRESRVVFGLFSHESCKLRGKTLGFIRAAVDAVVCKVMGHHEKLETKSEIGSLAYPIYM